MPWGHVARRGRSGRAGGVPRGIRLAAPPLPGDGQGVLALLLVASLGPALGHPGMGGSAADPNGGMPGQRVEVALGPGTVRVDYFVELAAIRLYKEAKAEGAEGSTWAGRRAETLRSGLRVRLDDIELPLHPIAVERSAAMKEGKFVEFHVAAEASLGVERGTLEVRLDNFPDEPCYYAASVDVGGELVIQATDLARVKEGRLRDNKHGAWRRDDAGRIVRLSFRPTRSWESHARGPLPDRLEGLVGIDARVSMAGVVAGVLAVGSALVFWTRRRRHRSSDEPSPGSSSRD